MRGIRRPRLAWMRADVRPNPATGLPTKPFNSPQQNIPVAGLGRTITPQPFIFQLSQILQQIFSPPQPHPIFFNHFISTSISSNHKPIAPLTPSSNIHITFLTSHIHNFSYHHILLSALSAKQMGTGVNPEQTSRHSDISPPSTSDAQDREAAKWG